MAYSIQRHSSLHVLMQHGHGMAQVVARQVMHIV